MRKRRYRYSRWPLGLASLTLIVLWLASVGLWPRLDPAPADRRTRTTTRLRFVTLSPTAASLREGLLGFLYQPDRPLRMPDDLQSDVAIRALEPHPHLLPYRHDALPAERVLAGIIGLSRQAARSLQHYEPQWPPLRPFTGGPPYALQLDVQTSGKLTDCGFILPEAARAMLAGGDKPWEYTYYVICAEDGRARDVFALSEAVTSGVQSNVVRALQQGQSRPGLGCEGRVIVRWADMPVDGAGVEDTERDLR